MRLEREGSPSSSGSNRCREGDWKKNGVIKVAKRWRRNSQRQSRKEWSMEGQGQGGFQENPNKQTLSIANAGLHYL